MALTIVGTPQHTVTDGATAVTVTISSLTAGDKVLACWRHRNAGVPTTVTALGNSMTQLGSTEVGSFIDVRWYQYIVGGGDPSSGDVVATLDTSLRQALVVWVFRGWDTVGTPAAVTTTAASITQDVSSQSGSIVVAAGYVEDTVAITQGAGQTERQNETDTIAAAYFASDEPGATTVTMSHSWTGSLAAVQSAVNVTAAAGGGATLEQEGYRIRNDDGSESSASWKAAQDTAVSMTLGAARVRVLLDATNDPASKAVGLKYAVNGGQKRSVN